MTDPTPPATIEDADNDDAQLGHIVGRREALTLFGAASLAALVACTTGNGGYATGTATSTLAPTGTTSAGPSTATGTATGGGATAASATVAAPSCIVRPAMTEGPYFVDEQLNRSDIRPSTKGDTSATAGMPLTIALNVARMGAGTCAALSGAMVDMWQCNALGAYSAVNDPTSGATARQQNFLRGFQMTDANGVARFTTIYPGWYRGRAVHIHFKIRARNSAGAMQEFTSQFFFDDALSDTVFAQAPYNTKGARDTRNANDGIYRGGGSELLLTPTKTADGYAVTFAIGMQLT